MKIKTQLIAFFILCLSFSYAQQQRNCFAMEDLKNRMLENPSLMNEMAALETFTQKRAEVLMEENQNQSIQGNVITIPVVIHVLYTNNSNNISDAQIQSQMAVLNRDFRRTNPDATNYWSQAADSQIEFKLATVDPNGNATNGITRKYVNTSTWGMNNNMKRSSQGGVNPWEPSKYLNMWIVDNISTGGSAVLGYAQFPGGSPSTDGVVMADQYFGTTGTAQYPFDGGRTTTHEVGHYLYLYHIWGDGPCGSDDNVNDTPASDAANYNCKTGHVSCGSEDMVQNYMDYSDDGCMNLFTQGQKSRMRSVLSQGGYRYSLALSDRADGPSTGCTPSTPNNVGVSNITSSSAYIYWSDVSDTTYDIRYKKVSSYSWMTSSISNNYKQLNNLTASTSYEVQIRSKCSGNVSNYSSSKIFSTVATPDAYCASQGESVEDEYIQKVIINTINNISSGDNGYSDFTNQSTDLEKDKSYTISITPKWTGSQYNEGYGVWIDLNQDNDFSDAGEMVFSKAPSKVSPVTGTFNIPSSALSGTTRLRVVMKYNATPTACEPSFDYGEVEDYTVNIVENNTDTEKPSTPANLQITEITSNSVALSWSSSTDNVGVTAYNIYQDGVVVSSTATTSKTISALSSNTSYIYQVSAMDEAGNESLKSNLVTATTDTDVVNPTPNDYCISQGESVEDEYIQNVTLNTINNSSDGNNGYTDFTSISTNLEQENTYEIIIKPQWTGTIYSEGYGVWIDFNQDGDFADAGENVLLESPSKATEVSSSFEVPTTALTGNTRMRVVMKYNATPTACQTTFDYGEVEDYTINIVNDEIDTEKPSQPTALYALGITANEISLVWNASSDNIGVAFYNIYQNGTWVNTSATTSETIVDLLPSTSYSYQISAVDEAGNESIKSIAVAVTTQDDIDNPAPLVYCTSMGESVEDEYIQNVRMNNLDNNSEGGNGYTDFTAISVDLNIGSTNSMTITPYWTGQKYKEGYGIWIDLNQDGDFDDAGELMFSKAASYDATINAEIDIPMTTLPGATRMRIALKYNGIPTACETFEYGEVEDYTVNIVNNSNKSNLTNVLDINANQINKLIQVYPNPAHEFIRVKLYNHSKALSYQIINLSGAMVQNGVVFINHDISIKGLPMGMYVIILNDGQREFKTKFLKN